MSNKVEIGQNIVLLRKARHISQEQLALRLEMSVSFLRAIEHGRANPSLDSLRRLSETLEVDIWVFFLYRQDEESILAVLHEARNVSVRQKVGVR